jgi:hypothetical protein
MRVGAAFAVALGLLAATALPAAAPPHIDGVLIGLRGGPDISLPDHPDVRGGVGRSRNGVWTPVQVTLKAGHDGVTRGAFRLVVESNDGEAVAYRYTVPVPAISADGEQVVFAYARPGNSASTFNVTLESADGKAAQTVARLQRDTGELRKEVLEPPDVLYLTVGSRLPALKRAVKPAEADANNNDEEDRPAPGFAYVERVSELPDRWFGYEAVDVVVLATSGDAFITQLLQKNEAARRDALLDWVRRGGRLILTVGRNEQAVAHLLDRMPLLSCGLTARVGRDELPRLAAWSGRGAREQPLKKVEIAGVKPGPGTSVLVREAAAAGDLEERPVVLQSACGLGRVVLVAFDLDAPPFSTWEGRTAFWRKLIAEVAPHPAGAVRPESQGGLPRGELAADLKRGLETFDEVPVISFGWVALFILFYLVLIGPLDYFVLRKVFKRLEWTWVTLPVLVLLVSAGAYATAYWLKGDEQRINKIDLIEIDLHDPPQVYGTSWFTVFSPRVRTYTVGVEPAAPGWCASWGEEAPAAAVVVATMDGPEPSLGGNTPSLFRRPYDYAADAAGLERLPVPVWATRTFTASWRAPQPAGGPPVAARLRASRGEGDALAGTISNNLPARLQGAVLFYRGQWRRLGDLEPGEAREVSPLFERDVQPHGRKEWFSDFSVLEPRLNAPAVPQSGGQGESGRPLSWQALSSYRTVRSLMFHGASEGEGQLNSGLRGLDQGWRLLPQPQVPPPARYRDEAILVARTPLRAGPAEEVSRDGVSATRLWLDRLPGSAAVRPALSGRLLQETYVRVYIPVQPATSLPARQP